MNILKSLILAFGLLIASHAKAGFITTNELTLDNIFSQTSFGNMPIDIRIGAASELIFPHLLDISSDAEVIELFNMHVGDQNIVNFYFIDTISACGGTINTRYVGCGEFPGNDFIVESSFAASSSGSELLAHELGHNLGLPHLSGRYLMNPSLNGNTTITQEEVNIIHNSSLVQTNGRDFWININPVLIVAAASTPVPEPSTLMLILLSAGLLFRKKIKI
jgi:hypothetical protein